MEKCLKKDIDEMTIVPYFLYPGRKVKIAVADAMKYQKDTKIRFLVSKPMTLHKTLVELVDNNDIDNAKDITSDHNIVLKSNLMHTNVNPSNPSLNTIIVGTTTILCST